MNIVERMNELSSLKCSEDVANFLRQQGIKGRRLTQCSCPVARYVGAGAKVLVGKYSYRYFSSDTYYDTPEIVRAFICNFDRGYYPDLVET